MGVAFGCVGNTIRLRSGCYLDLSNPHPDQFTLGDIAGALSKICRFGGQIGNFYSVAEHSLMCLYVAEEDDLTLDEKVACLMHDAAEAFVGDVVKPLKMMLTGYDEIESRVEQAIASKFGVDFIGTKATVRKIDHELLIAERRALFSVDDVQWAGEADVRRVHPPIACWLPDEAERQFMREAAGLMRIRGE